jgi:ubiquinone/menaquinone biosynthesis C-methylase UbiE
LKHKLTTDFYSVTEIAGDEVTAGQVQRLCNRYGWAGQFCRGKDVLEVACGTGQGLSYLAAKSKSFAAGDYCEKVLDIARAHYGNRISLCRFDAQNMPFKNRSKDVIIIFEAIYYLPNAIKFVMECSRILRPGGKVLLCTANKDLYDFNPSPYSYKYYGVAELKQLFSKRGYTVVCYGDISAENGLLKSFIFRFLKMLAARLGLMPKTMAGKKWLKRIVFGQLVNMPREIVEEKAIYMPPMPISMSEPNMCHKVIYCDATLI